MKKYKLIYNNLFLDLTGFRNLSGLFLLLFFTFQLSAQDYPVRANLYLIPPYSQNFADYYAPGNNLLFANILLADASQGELEVTFKITITGDRLKLTSKPNLTIAPITLQGGMMTRVTGDELASYFMPQNLLVEGSGAQAFLSSGKLPEGYYIFSIEVVEFYRKTIISNQGLAFAWVMFNDPPQWITPVNYSILTASDPQYILFTWMAMNTSSPNSALTTHYEFKLCQMPDASSNPQTVLAGTSPIYTDEIDRTSFLYDASMPLLETGKYYVCQLRAFDSEGRDQFRNNGLSLPLVFKFGEPCQPPLQLNHSDVHKSMATFRWKANTYNAGYELQIRQNSDEGLTDWYTYPTEKTRLTVKQLQPGIRYEYQLRARCGNTFSGLWSPFTDILSFTTQASGNTQYNCNDVVEPPVISSTLPSNSLRVGQVINAAGFLSTVTRIESSQNNQFTGYSETLLTIWSVKVYCRFTNITVNAAGQLLSGTIEALHTEEVVGQNPGENGGSGPTSNDSVPGTFTPDSLIVTNTMIDSVVVTDNGTTIIYEGDGTITEVAITDNLQIEDPDGNVYVVEEGKVYKNPDNVTPSGGGPGNTNYSKLITVRFTKQGDMPFYGFDQRDPRLPAFDANYEQVAIHRRDYFVPWVATPSFSSDVVVANVNLQGEGAAYRDVQFRSPTGPLMAMPGNNDSTFYVAIQGADNGSTLTYEAFYTDSTVNGSEKEITAGQLNVASYDATTIDVCLVSVNGTIYPYDTVSLQANLNTIFRQAVASDTVSTMALTDVEWDVDPQNNKLSDSETGLLSSYNHEMKRLRSAVKDHDSYNEDTYYLFILPASDDAGLAGYMPLTGHFGFIFTQPNNNEQKITRTIAHELSHGAFNLWHTFSSNNMFIASQGATHNLMDYTNNPADKDLIKYQWDYIHDPESIWFAWSEDESESEMVSIPDLLLEIRNANLTNNNYYEITKDVCPHVCYENIKLGSYKLDYLQINCTNEFENQEFENGLNSYVNWGIENDAKALIAPNVKNIVKTQTNKGAAIYYKFYQYEESSSPLLYEKTNNLLFEFVLLEKDADKFEDYVFPFWETLLEKTTLTSSEIECVRNSIKNIPDINRKKELYLKSASQGLTQRTTNI